MMNKRTLSLALISVLLAATYIPTVPAHNAPFPPTYDPSHLVIDTIAEPQSLDPAWAYDTASEEVIFNVYETMVFFNCDYTLGPYAAGKVDQFVPRLATSWISQAINEISPEGLTWVERFTFTIRQPVSFHDGTTLTTADVEYSFERLLVQDRFGGPQWMLFYWLLGDYIASDPVSDPNFGLKIDHAVQSDATHVWFNMVLPAPYITFLQILSKPWASIVNKAWAVGKGDFDGNWATGWQTIWDTWHDPPVSFIEGDMMGTGPYKFDYWTLGVAYSVVKYDDYWDGWPARAWYGSAQRIGGYIDRVTWNLLPDWPTRRPRFLVGDTDMTYVPRQYRDQVLGQLVGGELIRSYWRAPPNAIQSLALDAFFFTFNINTMEGTNPYAPSWLPAGTFSTAGIPPDIFSDVNVRKGFAHAFDYNSWLAAAYLGEGARASDPIISGLLYDNPAQSMQNYDLTLATYYLMLAWGGVDARSGVPGTPVLPENPAFVTPGALWTNGMKFRIVYNIGNVGRQTAAEMLRNNVNGLNPLFQIDPPIGLAWGSYLADMIARKLPIFINGWTADYTDPDDFAFAFMHSQGTFASAQGYSNPRVDALVEAGAVTPDDLNPYAGQLDQSDPRPLMNPGPPAIPPDVQWPRRSIYYELQAIYAIDDVPSVPLVQPLMRHWEQAWMRGWYYNPLYGGSLSPGLDSAAPTTPAIYAYHLWKAKTHFGDVNNDGAVNVLDWLVLSSHWYTPGSPPYGPAGFNPRADINGGRGGTSGSGDGPVKGMPDGLVDILDVSLISAYWDGPPNPDDLILPSTPPLFIGDSGYLQANPFESNPTTGSYLNIGIPTGTIANAEDGDFTTNINWRIGYSTTVGYVEMRALENTPPTTYTIGWVDIKMNYKVPTATTDDRYRIVYQVAPSTSWLVLQDWISGASSRFAADGSQDERAWSNVVEPNDGTWDWTDIGNVKVRVETQRIGTEDSFANRFYLYDVWLTIYEGTYPAAGGVSIQPPLVSGLNVGDIFFIDVFGTDFVNVGGYQFLIYYDPTVLTPTAYFGYNPFTVLAKMGANDIVGYVGVSFTSYMGSSTGYTGSGPIARIYFSVDADGASLLHFSQSILGTILGDPITHTTADGLFVTLADIAITNITPSKTVVGQGFPMSIDVTVENHGRIGETFDVTAYYDSNIIGTQTVTLDPSTSTTITFPWTTTGVPKGSYTISAHAAQSLGELDLTDNTLADGTVSVSTPGDVDASGVVDIIDVALLNAHWTGPPAGPLGYDPNCDINSDGFIDLIDVGIVSAYWTGPPKGPLAP